MTTRSVRTLYGVGVKDETQKGIRSVRRSLSSLNTAFASIGAGLSVAGLAAFTAQTARAVDDIGKLSAQLNISAESLSSFKFVAEQTGVEFRTLTTSFQRLGRRVAEAANGTGEARDALKELGLSARELNQLSIDDQFRAVARALGDVENANDRVRLAFKLFDSEGVALLRTINATGGSLEDLERRGRELGRVFGSDLTQQAADFRDASNELRSVFQGLGLEIFRNTAPALTRLASGATTAIEAFRFLAEEVGLVERNLQRLTLGQLLVEQDELIQKLQQIGEKRQRILESGRRPRSSRVLGGLNEAIEETTGKLAEIQKRLDLIRNPPRSEGQAGGSAAASVAGPVAQETARLVDLSEAVKLTREAYADMEKGRESWIRSFGSEQQGIALELGRIRDLGETYGIGTDEIIAAQRRLIESSKEVADVELFGLDEETVSTTLQSIERQVDRFSNNLVDSVFDASNTIGDIFKDLVNNIAQEFFRLTVADPISQGLKGLLGNITSGGGFDLGKLFSGFFATGGFIPPGTFGVVGERGPEFVAGGRQGATVTPMSGANVNLTFNVNTLDGRQAASVLAENRDFIVGMIQGAFNRAGTGARMA